MLPRYGERSLCEVLPSAVSAIGAPGWQNLLNLPSASSYVVLLVDGLGWQLLGEHADDAPYLASLLPGSDPLTSGVPSTTATSLTCIGTGLPTGRHGVVGFTSRIPGTDRLLEALRWDSRVDARQWQPYDTVFAKAEQSGVTASVVSRRRFQSSGLTVASQRGARYVAADSGGERIFAAVRCARSGGSLTYVYDGDLDATGHAQGCGSWAWRYQLTIIDGFAATLREALPDDTVLVVTADHGMVDVAATDRVDVDAEPELLDGVSLVGGEARFRHLYCRGGAVADVAARWRERLGHDAAVVVRDDAIERGWFGAVDADVRPRLGDVIVASLGPVAVVSSTRFPVEISLVGLHGSLTAAEMLVPILVDAPAAGVRTADVGTSPPTPAAPGQPG